MKQERSAHLSFITHSRYVWQNASVHLLPLWQFLKQIKHEMSKKETFLVALPRALSLTEFQLAEFPKSNSISSAWSFPCSEASLVCFPSCTFTLSSYFNLGKEIRTRFTFLLQLPALGSTRSHKLQRGGKLLKTLPKCCIHSFWHFKSSKLHQWYKPLNF